MKLGGMDEKLFTPYYWEDLDLSYRAMKRGFRLLWEPKAVVNHNHESTISKLSKRKVLRIQERNELLFIWKNITSVNLFRKHMAGLLRRIFKGPGYLLIIILAICKLQIVLKERKREKKESKVSDEAIFAGFV
jgi:GT2 family glycosyltransferase